jgi:hypothetical protein
MVMIDWRCKTSLHGWCIWIKSFSFKCFLRSLSRLAHDNTALFSIILFGYIFLNIGSVVCMCMARNVCYLSSFYSFIYLCIIIKYSHVCPCLLSVYSFTWSLTFFAFSCLSFISLVFLLWFWLLYLQKIAQLLHQIAQMNEILIERHKALATKVVKWLGRFANMVPIANHIHEEYW